jgi:hypothetical protein
MDPVLSSAQNAAAMSVKDALLLKKAQDFHQQQASALIAALPEAAPPPSPEGVGNLLDVYG